MRALLTACCYYQLLRGDYGGLPNATERAEQILSRAPRPARESSAIIKGARACQHGQSAVWAVPQLGSCSSSGHSWRLWAARYSQEEVGPLGAQPLPRVLELAASQAAYFLPLTIQATPLRTGCPSEPLLSICGYADSSPGN